MNRLGLVSLVLPLIVALGGCPTAPEQPADGGGPATFADVSTQQDRPPITGAEVRVQVANDTNDMHRAQVRMSVASRQVHLSQRRVHPNGEITIIGPDEADSVTVQAVRATDDALVFEQTFRINTDFTAGQTILVRIAPIVPGDGGGDGGDGDGDGGGEDVPLTFAFDGLTANQTAFQGDLISFDLVASGFSANATVRAIARLVNQPEIQTELVNQPATQRTTVAWDTTQVAPGRYEIVATLTDGDDFITIGPAKGQVNLWPGELRPGAGVDPEGPLDGQGHPNGSGDGDGDGGYPATEGAPTQPAARPIPL